MSKEDAGRYLNYGFILFAFCFPISKAAVNVLELILVGLWIYEGRWHYKFSLMRSSRFLVVLLLFLGWFILSIPWAVTPEFAVAYIGKFHHFLLIPILYTSLQRAYIEAIFSAFIGSMFMSELLSYGIYFELLHYKDATPEFPTPFMHHITYSVVLAFTSTILLVKIFRAKQLSYRIFSALFFITVVMNLFINGGRTGQVVFIVLLFIVFLSFMQQKLRAVVLALFLVLTTLTLAYNFSDNFAARVAQFQKGINKIVEENDYRDQGGMRAALWITGVEVFLDHPLTGMGIGNAMKDANSYVAKHHFKTADMRMFADYHNVFINIAAQLGVVGLLLFCLLLYRLFRLDFKHREYRVLNRTFLVSFILFSMTHNTIHTMFPMVYFALFAGLFSAISRLDSQSLS